MAGIHRAHGRRLMASGITSLTQATWITANIVTATGLVQMVHGWKNTMAVTGAVIPLDGGMKTHQDGIHSHSMYGSTEQSIGSAQTAIGSNLD